MKTKTLTLIALLASAAVPVAAQAQQAAPATVMTNQDWWPERLDLRALRQHGAESNPMGDNFDYGAEFQKLDLNAVKADIKAVMTTSQDWWPADYGQIGRAHV